MAFSAPEPGDAPTAATRSPNGTPPEEHRPTPLLAVLGAGDAAVAAVSRAFADAYAAAASRRETVQHRVAELPTELEGCAPASPATSCAAPWRPTAPRSSGLRPVRRARRGDLGQAAREAAGPRAKTTLEPTPRSSTPASTTLRRRASRALRREHGGPASRGRSGRAGQRLSGPGRGRGRRRERGGVGRGRGRGHAAAQVIEEAGDEAATATRKATGAAGSSRKAAPRSTTPRVRSALRRPE